MDNLIEYDFSLDTLVRTPTQTFIFDFLNPVETMKKVREYTNQGYITDVEGVAIISKMTLIREVLAK